MFMVILFNLLVLKIGKKGISLLFIIILRDIGCFNIKLLFEF